MDKRMKIELVPESGNTGKWCWNILEYGIGDWYVVCRGRAGSLSEAQAVSGDAFTRLAEKEKAELAEKAQNSVDKRCEQCPHWTDRNTNDYGTCRCHETAEYGCRTISFHKCTGRHISQDSISYIHVLGDEQERAVETLTACGMLHDVKGCGCLVVKTIYLDDALNKLCKAGIECGGME